MTSASTAKSEKELHWPQDKDAILETLRRDRWVGYEHGGFRIYERADKAGRASATCGHCKTTMNYMFSGLEEAQFWLDNHVCPPRPWLGWPNWRSWRPATAQER